MATRPSNLTTLDFEEIKESIKSYLRTRSEFTDYDFEGSTLSYLLDILAYNTYYSAFNANLAVNELFLSTSTIRDNVVNNNKYRIGWFAKYKMEMEPEDILLTNKFYVFNLTLIFLDFIGCRPQSVISL